MRWERGGKEVFCYQSQSNGQSHVRMFAKGYFSHFRVRNAIKSSTMGSKNATVVSATATTTATAIIIDMIIIMIVLIMKIIII